MAKAYDELTRKFSSRDTTSPTASDAQQPQATQPTGDDTTPPLTTEDAQQIVEQARLSWDELQADYARNGRLSPQSYEALERAGLDRHVVDGYVAGQEAIVSQIRSETFARIGGEETYADMVAFAAQSFSEAEISAYNTAINSRDKHTRELALDGLKARFTAEHGSAPQLIGGRSGNGSGASGDVYTSTKALTEAMRDPRYATDKSYRDDVIARLGRSNLL